MLENARILLIISGGIAAYKSLDLIRRLREHGASVSVILTKGGAQFVTPLSVSALSAQPVYQELFEAIDQSKMGHIELSRSADLIVVAPASADLIAKLAHGLADDLASTALLATDKPALLAPAMNVRMWEHAATQRNTRQLEEDGIHFVGPVEGEMACGEHGLGRMAEVPDIIDAIAERLGSQRKRSPKNAVKDKIVFAQNQNAVASVSGALKGKHFLITSGPTFEPIDPVRFIANRSSGKQGHALAVAAAQAGARVTLISGPVALADPENVETIHVETAREMQRAVEAALPADVFISCAAVADWRVASEADEKLKKTAGGRGPILALLENPDILASIAKLKQDRPQIVIGFAAETANVLRNAQDKLARKGCDVIIANDVSNGQIFGSDDTLVHIISKTTHESWPRMSKADMATRLVETIADSFNARAA